MAKVHLTNGSVREVPLVTSAAIGYVATSIEIGAKDVTQMRMLFEGNPSAFRAFITQLEMRFPENRHPNPYSPCRWCGAEKPIDRCLGCLHDFGGAR